MKKILPIIANTDFERLGTIDDYISFIWTQRYYTPGDFELCVTLDSRNADLLQRDFYIMREDTDDVAIIEDRYFSKTAEGQETIVVTGRFLASILERRIIATQIQVSGTVANCVKALINANAISPAIAARKIPGLQYGTFTNAAKTMQQQFTGKNLLEAITEICENNECGMRIVLTNDNKFSFYLYDGVDRSYNQDANPYVIFSNQYDNLESSEYQENYTGIATDVLVAGEGEGTARKTVWANKTTNTGLARYELYQDARNASTNNGEISDSVYLAQLREEGLEQITNYMQLFAGEVNWNNYNLGEGVNIGDVVVIENTRWGIAINVRIIEIIESVDEGGVYSAIPTFAVGSLWDDSNGYLLAENSPVLLAENEEPIALLYEGAKYDPTTSEYSGAMRISELDEASTVADGEYLAVAKDGATRKFSIANLKNLFSGVYAALVHNHDSEYLKLSGGTLTGAVKQSATGNTHGVYLKDKAGFDYPAAIDNGSNLWIGATQTKAQHHKGSTFISTGHDGTNGNATINVSVPNAANDNATNYGVYHTGYKPALTDLSGTLAPANGGTGQTSLQAARNAMGLGDTTGALPIANGGTGQTAVTSVSGANALTINSAFTITAARVRKWGKLAMFYAEVKNKSALTSGTEYTVGTLTTGNRPADATFLWLTNNIQSSGTILGAGTLKLRPRAAVTANTTLYLTATYLLP